MTHINYTITTDLMTWDHGTGVCKLIRVPREEIDEDSDEPDAWDLVWIEAATNLRRFSIRLDNAYDRTLDLYPCDVAAVRQYLETAPPEAAEILKEWAI